MCHTIEIIHAPEKIYCSRENDTGQNKKDETHCKKQESTPLPLINNNIGSGMSKSATKEGMSRESSAHMSETIDAMMWAKTWETMNRTLEAVSTRNSESSDRAGT